MDASALSLLQKTAIDAEEARRVALGVGELIALPSDYAIHDLEKFQEGRRRFRGVLATNSIADFIAYVLRRKTAEVLPGFIDADALTAQVYFNLGSEDDPGHGDDRAALKLKPTAPYEAVQHVNGRQLQQKDFIDWLQDWAEEITFVDSDGANMPANTAISALRKITIRSTAEATSDQQQFKSSRSAMEDIEARGATALPAEVWFACTPYAGLPARTFRMRLSVLTNSDKPILLLRVRNLEAEKEGIAQDFKRVLLTDLEGAAALTLGNFTL